MADYLVVNGTDAELENVNVGGDDVAALTVSAALTLTDANLATLGAINGVAIIDATSTQAQMDAIAGVLMNNQADNDNDPIYHVANGTAVAIEGVNADDTDLPAYSVTAVPLSPLELAALAGTDGVAIIDDTQDDLEKHFALKVLKLGSNPGA